MSEIELSSNVIIDDVDEVMKHLAYRLNLDDNQSVDLDKIIDFIKTQDRTHFYMDIKMNMKTDSDKTEYLWLDTGLITKSGDAVFISLLNNYGLYCGHIVADYKYLASNIGNYYGANRKSISENKTRFKSKYERAIQNREIKHLDYADVVLGESGLLVEFDEDEVVSPVLSTEPAVSSFESADDDYEEKGMYSVSSKSPVTDEVNTLLMFNNWKTELGLDRYIKICGARLTQLIEKESSDYYLYDGSEFAIINTGLLNRFGRDILIMYKAAGTGSYKFIPWVVIESKSDVIKKGFTKTQANKELKPIQFFDNEESRVFGANIEDFDVSTSALMHIIDARRERFPEIAQHVSDSALVSKITDAIDRGIKIQQRDSSYIKATYSGKARTIAWVFPLHIDNELTEQPELALIVKKNDDFYEIKTIIPYDDVVKDRLTCLALYSV